MLAAIGHQSLPSTLFVQASLSKLLASRLLAQGCVRTWQLPPWRCVSFSAILKFLATLLDQCFPYSFCKESFLQTEDVFAVLMHGLLAYILSACSFLFFGDPL